MIFMLVNFVYALELWLLQKNAKCLGFLCSLSAYVKFDSLVIGISFPFIKCDHRHPKERQNFIDFDEDMMTS